MKKYIPREVYLQKLIDSREDGAVKVVTGPRRCGKSWLLTRLYKDYLIADGVPEENIFATGFCTACAPELFFSHRASGGRRGLMMAGIRLP